jgi:hypothetical protein
MVQPRFSRATAKDVDQANPVLSEGPGNTASPNDPIANAESCKREWRGPVEINRLKG